MGWALTKVIRRKFTKVCSWNPMIVVCLATVITIVYLVDWTLTVSTSEFSKESDLFGLENDNIQLENVKFSVNNKINCCKCTLSEICLKKKVFVIAVLSARHNFHRRTTIRNTWGSVRENKRWCIKLIFVLAENRNDNFENTIIAEESKIYNDVVVVGFTDTYRALTYKTLMSFKWVLEYCPETNYILKTDDDVFIEVFQLLKHLSNLKENNTISCKVRQFVVPQRLIETDKSYITENEFSEDFYPDYCMGTGYLISYDVVKTLYETSLTLPNNKIFWIEDVFITGILREYLMKINIMTPKLVSFSSKYNELDTKWKNWYKDRGEHKLPWIFIQTYDEPESEFEEDFIGLWNKTLLFYGISI